MRAMSTLAIAFIAITCLAACSPLTGQAPAPVSEWQKVPVASSYGLGVNIRGVDIVQLYGNDTPSLRNNAVSGVYSLIPINSHFELWHIMMKEKDLYPNADGTLTVDFPDGKTVTLRKNPSETKHWQAK